MESQHQPKLISNINNVDSAVTPELANERYQIDQEDIEKHLDYASKMSVGESAEEGSIKRAETSSQEETVIAK